MIIREPTSNDEKAFLEMTQQSQSFHQPWVYPPLHSQTFHEYIQRYQQPNQKSYLVISNDQIIGVFNLSEIVYGFFQNAYLGFYGNYYYAGKGLMSQGLKLVLQKAFQDLKLHRLEANIQPDNRDSIRLVQKNGFKKEGFSQRYLKINDAWRDHERWALTVEDWL